MRRPSFMLVLAGVAVSGATHVVAAELCRPALSLKNIRFSEVRNLQRSWSAVLSVDATMRMTRRVKVLLDFWRDEAVLDYSIAYVEPCVCREGG